MKIYKNCLANTELILNKLDKMQSLFVPREGKDLHTGIISGVYSKFSSLKSSQMSEDFINLIFDSISLPDKNEERLRYFYSFIQIQRYLPGEYIAPHFDLYDITKLYLFNLTSSDVDALVIEENGNLHRIPDVAGQYIDFDGKNVHWVNPVVSTRYSLVIGE